MSAVKSCRRVKAFWNKQVVEVSYGVNPVMTKVITQVMKIGVAVIEHMRINIQKGGE